MRLRSPRPKPIRAWSHWQRSTSSVGLLPMPCTYTSVHAPPIAGVADCADFAAFALLADFTVLADFRTFAAFAAFLRAAMESLPAIDSARTGEREIGRERRAASSGPS